jgi:protein tyrosine phosphatase (PTP) superfamily phosphohydrolase (DUF442 family)
MGWSQYLLRSFSNKPAAAITSAAVVLLVLLAGAPASPAHAASAQVPFGDRVSAAIFNYNRTTPHIATSGLLGKGGIGELKGLGFVAILDLRTPPEGTKAEQQEVEAQGLRYFNIPISRSAPSDEQIQSFARLVEDPANYPLLVHCGSANRVGAMWTRYRLHNGISFDLAIEEGRTIGMKPARELLIRSKFGKPSIDQ